ncbi:MAG: dihydropteroate synthase [Clostridiales bacterium]|nr:dihydropteroate synthase [Clostridiales bacterium]
MRFNELLKKNYIFLDGAMGTMLQAKGLQLGGIPELINISNPEWISDIHKSYINAGSDIIYTNTFGANRYKLKESGYTVDEIIPKAIEIAKDACKGTNTLVALDIGPIGQLLEPTGSLSFEEAYDIFKEQIIAGKDADLIVFETMTDLYEIKAAVLAAKENSKLPVICTMTFEQNSRTFTGCSVSAMALTLSGLGVDAIGLNCSLGPKELFPIVKELSEWTNLPIVVKPNAGLPDPVTNTYDITPDEFAEYMAEFAGLGVKIFGGCCGTTSEYIKALTEKLSATESAVSSFKGIPTAVCSSSKTVIINRPRVIGERINPTGKKMFKQALINHDISYILNQAVEQVNAGADILDVNVGLPEIDEKSMMVEVIKALQSISDTPLQIDSSDINALEAGLRVYNGKAIVNSVNAEDESLDSVLPLVKKYGACVIGLTLDKNGIPKTADERFRLAAKIMNKAIEYGIPKTDIFIDCLTLTASAEQSAVMETLKAVRMVKERLGLKTVLGVSNISFGLPVRELINHNFLTMALSYGLDLPIINPNITSMMGAVRSYNLLANIDKNAAEFIRAYGTDTTPAAPAEVDREIDIFYAMEHGLKAEGAKITEKLLNTHEPMSIVNEILIPALDKVGADFEKGIIFLPQLILSAEVAQSAFEVIKKHLVKNNISSQSKGKIILATVKGDIHDIGKNIVKVLLENYGYTVIDLGKDVDCQAVVDTAVEHNVKLVGLSALMTTTLKSMEETIKLLRDNRVNCKVMVGGAVLTPDYAIKIGADFYSKDAKGSVDIARKVLG